MTTLADLLQAGAKQALEDAFDAKKGELLNIAVAGGDAASNGFLGDIGDIGSILAGLLGDVPIIGGLVGGALGPVTAVSEGAGKLGSILGLGYLLGYLLQPAMEPFMRPIIHAAEHVVNTQILDPTTAADMVARGIISGDFGASEASGSGFDGQHFDWMEQAAEKRPALGELLTLVNRGLIDEPSAIDAMRHEGLPIEWCNELIKLRRVLLTPADLVLANLRGVLTDQQVAEYTPATGMSAQDMATLFDSTGEPPGLQFLMEMWRRGFITQDQFERGVRQSRVRNEWMPYIEAARFSPMSTADAINAAVQHQADDATARAITAQNGLEPEHFDILLGTYGSPLSREEMNELWHRGIATQADVEQALRESHLKDKYIPFALSLARRLIPYRTINTIVEHGVWTHDQGVAYLESIGYTPEDAQALIATSTSTKTAAVKQITEGQILALYEAGGVPHADAIKLLADIGYDSEQAQYILDAQLATAALKEQNRAITAIRKAFMGQRIFLADARTKLDQIHVLPAQRDQLLAEWAAEFQARVEELTPSEICNAVKYGLVDFSNALEKLVTLGYSQNDALIKLGVVLHALPPGFIVQPL